MEVFHYAKRSIWGYVEADQRLKGSQMIAGRPRIFALPEPVPASWADNEEFPGVWEDLRGAIGDFLLRIDIDGLEDQIEVVDWANLGPVLSQNHAPNREVEAAKREYAEKALKWGEFLEDPSKVKLPEILLPSPVSWGRVQIHSEQPMLAWRLDEWEGDEHDQLMRWMRQFPELKSVLAAA